MDEFDGPIMRRQSGFSPLLAAIFLGAVFGGGLGLQGRSLQSLASDARSVLDAPALGGTGSAAAQWTPREDPAQSQTDLERQLTAPWPADRMRIPAALRPSQALAVPIRYGLAATRPLGQ